MPQARIKHAKKPELSPRHIWQLEMRAESKGSWWFWPQSQHQKAQAFDDSIASSACAVWSICKLALVDCAANGHTVWLWRKPRSVTVRFESTQALQARWRRFQAIKLEVGFVVTGVVAALWQERRDTATLILELTEYSQCVRSLWRKLQTMQLMECFFSKWRKFGRFGPHGIKWNQMDTSGYYASYYASYALSITMCWRCKSADAGGSSVEFGELQQRWCRELTDTPRSRKSWKILEDFGRLVSLQKFK